jgi:hypothetical protein
MAIPNDQIKGPKLHHAQQSLTNLIQSSTKVNIDMHANKTCTNDTSHRSRVEAGVQVVVIHVHLR